MIFKGWQRIHVPCVTHFRHLYYLHGAHRLFFHFASCALVPDGCLPPMLRPDTSQLSSGGPDPAHQSLTAGGSGVHLPLRASLGSASTVEAEAIQTALSM